MATGQRPDSIIQCTQIRQPIIEPSPAMIKTLVRHSQPLHLVRKQLIAIISEYPYICPVKLLRILIDLELGMFGSVGSVGGAAGPHAGRGDFPARLFGDATCKVILLL